MVKKFKALLLKEYFTEIATKKCQKIENVRTIIGKYLQHTLVFNKHTTKMA